MGRSWRYFGLAVLAVAAWVSIAGEAAWIPASVADSWFRPLLIAGGACFCVGAALAVIAPGLRWVRQGYCVRCGAPTVRGQTYCLDHLTSTVHEARDHVRDTDRRARRRHG